jgi:hypothetical protein
VITPYDNPYIASLDDQKMAAKREALRLRLEMAERERAFAIMYHAEQMAAILRLERQKQRLRLQKLQLKQKEKESMEFLKEAEMDAKRRAEHAQKLMDQARLLEEEDRLAEREREEKRLAEAKERTARLHSDYLKKIQDLEESLKARKLESASSQTSADTSSSARFVSDSDRLRCGEYFAP